MSPFGLSPNRWSVVVPLAAAFAFAAAPAAAGTTAITITSTFDHGGFEQSPGANFSVLGGGPFTASGAFTDSGTHTEQAFFAGSGGNSPTAGGQNSTTIHGQATFDGTSGTFTTAYSCLAYYADPGFSCQWSLVSGTGAYADAHGQGTLTVVNHHDLGYSDETWSGTITP